MKEKVYSKKSRAHHRKVPIYSHRTLVFERLVPFSVSLSSSPSAPSCTFGDGVNMYGRSASPGTGMAFGFGGGDGVSMNGRPASPVGDEEDMKGRRVNEGGVQESTDSSSIIN